MDYMSIIMVKTKIIIILLSTKPILSNIKLLYLYIENFAHISLIITLP